MRTLNLAETRPSIEQILAWAQEETVLIQTRTGADFIVATKIRNEVAHTLCEDPISDKYWEIALASVLSALVEIATRKP